MITIKAIVPSAGYATRLYPLTKNRPKALLEVKGKPILEHIIARIRALPRVNAITVVSNDKYFKEFEEWAKGFKSAIPIKILNDGTKSNEDRKGQVGDIQFAIDSENIEKDLLVVAGDNLFNFSLKPAYDFFKEKNCIVNGLWESKSIETAKQQGIAVIDSDKRITEFQEKDTNPKSTLISLGLYFLPKEKVKLFKQFIEEGNNADKMGYFMIWLLSKERLSGYVYKEKWFDIGWHSALEKARKEFVP